jgi:hypothetical protein
MVLARRERVDWRSRRTLARAPIGRNIVEEEDADEDEEEVGIGNRTSRLIDIGINAPRIDADDSHLLPSFSGLREEIEKECEERASKEVDNDFREEGFGSFRISFPREHCDGSIPDSKDATDASSPRGSFAWTRLPRLPSVAASILTGFEEHPSPRSLQDDVLSLSGSIVHTHGSEDDQPVARVTETARVSDGGGEQIKS